MYALSKDIMSFISVPRPTLGALMQEPFARRRRHAMAVPKWRDRPVLAVAGTGRPRPRGQAGDDLRISKKR